jgi:hypothetical protein
LTGLQGVKQRITKQRKFVRIVIWMKHTTFRGYDVKKEVGVDVKIPMGFGCRIAVYKKFVGVTPLIQRASCSAPEKIP